MLTLLVALVACDPGSTEPAHHSAAPATPDHPAADHASHPAPEAPAAEATGLGLVLDGDKKWSMDAHTRTTVDELRRTLGTAQVSSVQGAVALSGTLQQQLDRLIAGCTMQGPSHDQLHVFLVAFMPEVKALGEAPDADAAASHLAELQAMMVEYDQVFE